MSSVYPAPSESMIIDVVDAVDRPVDTISRRDVLPSAKNFRVAHLFIFNSAGELLVQQLASSRERHPQRWGSSVAAYLFAGESYADAITRRALQELGFEGDVVEVGKTVMRDRASKKFITLFRAVSDRRFSVVDSNHISQVAFVPMAKIAKRLIDSPRNYTPTFRHLFKFYRSIANG